MAGTEASGARDRRIERLESRLTIPVIVAAMVSVPAVFLARLEGPVARAGEVLNWASLVILTGESAVLFLLAGDRIAWLRTHRWVVSIAIITVPAVVLSIGPVQVLRLVRVLTALQVLRAARILRAGEALRRRMGLRGVLGNVLIVGVSLLAAGFVAVVLADPTSRARMLLREPPGGFMLAAILVAAAILAVATVLVLVNRRR